MIWGTIPVQYTKGGISPNLRARMYKKILHAEITKEEIDYYAQTYYLAAKWETAIDDWHQLTSPSDMTIKILKKYKKWLAIIKINW